jgi:hypothetical protein
MPSLAEVRSRKIWVDPPVHMFGEVWKVAYSPGILTPDFEEEMARVQAQMGRLQRDAELADTPEKEAELEQRADAMAKRFWVLLGKMITDWDVTETSDGPVLPRNAKTFKVLPSPLLSAFVDAIRDSASPGKAAGESPNGSGSVTSSEAPRLTSIP